MKRKNFAAIGFSKNLIENLHAEIDKNFKNSTENNVEHDYAGELARDDQKPSWKHITKSVKLFEPAQLSSKIGLSYLVISK